jgi:predicted alpha/beta superfamily hydrolase
MTGRRVPTPLVVLAVGALLPMLAMLAASRSEPRGARGGKSLQGPEMITTHSDVLGEDRSVLVWLPERYEDSLRRYPVLYVLDGEYFFRQAVAAVQFLSELGYEGGQHPIPEMIVVGVVNVDRERDYTPTHAPEQSRGRLSFPTSGGARRFAEYLEKELIPLVDTRYRTRPHRVLSGWSLGGLFTVHTYLERPGLFSRYLAISPSLWWDDSVVVRETRRRLRAGGALPSRRLVITLGTLEGGDMDGAVRRDFIPLLARARRPAPDFTFVEIPNENHGHVPYKAYFDGLSRLYSDWLVPSDVLRGGLASVRGFFDGLSERWGYPVSVPLSVYASLSATVPDFASALEVARRAVAEYSHSSVAYLSLGRLQQIAADTAAAVASLERALRLELARPVPQSERLRAIRGRLGRLRWRGRGR